MIEQNFGKRNKPTIAYLYESDFEHYGDTIKEIFERPSEYRSKNTSKYLFVGGALVAYCWKNSTKIASVFSIEDLQEMADPVKNIASCKGIKTLSADREIQVRTNTLFWFGEEKPRIVSKPKVPRNAWLIRIKPLTWIQVCEHGFFITRGAVWCDEEIRETSYSEHRFIVAKHGGKWLIMIPRIEYKGISYHGLFIASKNRLIQEWYWNNVGEKVVFKNISYEIMFDGQKYWGSGDFGLLPKEYFEMVEVEYEGKRFYVPYAIINQYPHLKRIVSGVFS